MSEGKTGQRDDVTEQAFTPEEVIEAFQLSMGSVADAARELKCDRKTLYRYCDRYPEVQDALNMVRSSYRTTCVEFARDNHLTQLMLGGKDATAYELSKLEPKPDGLYLDMTKLTPEEAATLHHLIQKAKPDGSGAAA